MNISVIMPCHNAATWITEALDSVEAQTLSPMEIVVIDDASSDQSSEVVSDWSRRNSTPVVLERIEEHNAAAARNVGVGIARGSWLALLDADDRWEPIHLERAARLLENGNDAAFLGRCRFMREDGEGLPARSNRLTETAKGLSARDYVRNVVNRGWCFSHCTVMYEKSRFFDLGGYDPSQVRRHDIDLWLRFISASTWTYDEQFHAIYRTGTSGALSRETTEAALYSFEAILRNREKLPYPETERIVQWQAFKLINSAWTDGDSAQRARMVRYAWSHLTPTQKVFLAPFRPFPLVYRLLNQIRRRVLGIEVAVESN